MIVSMHVMLWCIWAVIVTLQVVLWCIWAVIVSLQVVLWCSWAVFVSLQVVLFELESFQGRKVELSAACKDVTEKGLEKVGSVLVDCGP